MSKRANDLLYTKNQKFKSMDARGFVKEDFQNLKQPRLISKRIYSQLMTRPLVKDDIWKKCKQLYKAAGLKISNPENLQIIYKS